MGIATATVTMTAAAAAMRTAMSGELDAFLRGLRFFGSLELRQNSTGSGGRIVEWADCQRLSLARQGCGHSSGAGDAKKASEENASFHGSRIPHEYKRSV
jgi:hypothetical protein